MKTMQRLFCLLALPLILSGCAMFDNFWNPLQTPTVVNWSWNKIQITAPTNWRIFKRSKSSPIILTVSGFPLNQIEVTYPKFKNSCFVTQEKAKRTNMVSVQSNYQSCLNDQLGRYTVKDVKTSPYRHQGLEGIQATSMLLPQNGGVPIMLKEYIVIDNENKSLASLKFFSTQDINYEKYLPDFESVVKSLVIKSANAQ